MTERLKTIGNSLWSHRAVYAGLAAAYGAACLNLLDKDTVNQIVTALYVALVVQADH